MAFGASPYSYTAGEWMFEHRKAVPTPLGGGTIAHSLIRPSHLAPCHDIRYSLGAFLNRLNRLVCPIQEDIWRATRVGVFGWPVFEHREAFLTPLGGGTITRSLIRTAHLAPCHDIRYSRCQTEPSKALVGKTVPYPREAGRAEGWTMVWLPCRGQTRARS